MKNLIVAVGLMALVAGCGKNPADSQTEMAQPPAQEDFLQKGVQSLTNGDVVTAIKSFDDAIKQNPVDPKPYMILGQTYMHLKEYNRAIDTYSAALRVSPDKGMVYYLLAINYGLAGKFDMAKKNAEASIEIFRQNKDEQNFLRAVSLLQGLSKNQSVPEAHVAVESGTQPEPSQAKAAPSAGTPAP
jgi:tetratricopeptide (TPR) repeat protein